MREFALHSVNWRFFKPACAWLLFAISFSKAQAYPEMIRHAYGHCGTCHVSPSGAGMLTEYGRGLSKEVLSSSSTENEALAFYGAIKLPKNLSLGGGISTIQTYTDTPKYRQGRYFLMQADLDLAWITDNFTVVANIGRDIQSPDTASDDKWTSSRHYLLVPLSEVVSVRVGRFQKNYGLNIPDHIAQIKRGLGWDNQMETYNAELNIITEDYSIALTAIAGRPDDDDEDSDKGYSASAARIFTKAAVRAGFSYFAAQGTDDTEREIFGPNLAWGVTEKAYLLAELDWVRVAPPAAPLIEGYVSYARAGYEVFKGLDLTMTHELKKTDRRDSEYSFIGYGPGLLWSPRPHISLSGQWQKQQRPSSSKSVIDNAWLVMNYWL
ncbi:MAG: hypothetical protein NTX25_23145 [Proteobacteria bacterium]|nr:hypothetical protein [Pseudomonadota bacterium]